MLNFVNAGSIPNSSTASTDSSRPSSPEIYENGYMSATKMPDPDGNYIDPLPFQDYQLWPSTEFWFENGSAVIAVEDTLYNIHASVLEAAVEPLTLDISKLNFELLLAVIYPSDSRSRYDFSVDEWFGMVNVATALEFKSIKKEALESIFDMCDAFELVILGRKYDIPECLSSAFHMLCFDDEPLTLDEGQSIGIELVIQVAHAREKLAKGVKWADLENGLFLSLVSA